MGAPLRRSSLEMVHWTISFASQNAPRPYGVMICALVGAIGGLFGQYAAWIREFIATLRR